MGRYDFRAVVAVQSLNYLNLIKIFPYKNIAGTFSERENAKIVVEDFVL